MLARLPDSIFAKLIYSQGWVLAETKSGYLNYTDVGSWFKIYFSGNFSGDANYLSLDKRGGGWFDFVMEQESWNKSQIKYHDCKNEVDPSLQKYVSECRGYLRVRPLKKEDHEQIAKFVQDTGIALELSF